MKINKGDTVSRKGPDGSFLLPENHDQHLFFLASGSGIVPFRCMLQDMSYNGNPYKSITLYFGVRKEKTIPLSGRAGRLGTLCGQIHRTHLFSPRRTFAPPNQARIAVSFVVYIHLFISPIS
ncbi:MAG: hypothetical protein IPK61_17825 [Saprospiraceae bacterium]|nr:hypothetical protein [Saprospiraceae bacterium]